MSESKSRSESNQSEPDVKSVYEFPEEDLWEAASAPNNSESYDYDVNNSFSTFYLGDLIPTSLVYGITLILGLIGNGLIIYTVVRYRRMRTISNFFLASLATADLLLNLVCVPVKFAQLFSFTWTLGSLCCKLVHYVQNVSAISSVLTLTAMSVERYYAVMYPVKSRYMCTMSQAQRVINVIWLISLIASLPVIFVQVLLPVGVRVKGYWCIRNWDHPRLWQLYECYMITVVLIVPSLVMGYAYFRICHQLWIVVKERANMMSGESFTCTEMARKNSSSQNHLDAQSIFMKSKPIYTKMEDDTKTVKQVIKMLAAVVLLFIICWSPILINNVLTSFGILDTLNYGYLKPMRTIFHLLSYFNSCVNPCVYGFMSKNFRRSFKAALYTCICGKGGTQNVGAQSMSRTRTYSISFARSTYIS